MIGVNKPPSTHSFCTRPHCATECLFAEGLSGGAWWFFTWKQRPGHPGRQLYSNVHLPHPPPKDPPSRLPLGHQGWCLRDVVFTLRDLLRPSYFPVLPAKIVHPEHTRSPTCVSLRGEDGLLAGWPGGSWRDVGPVGNQGSKSNGVGKVAPREGESREVHGILPSGQPLQAQSHGFWTLGF